MQIGNTANLAYQGIQNGYSSLNEHTQQIVNPNHQNLEKGLVGLGQDKTQVEASVKAAKTENDMIGTIIDLMA